VISAVVGAVAVAEPFAAALRQILVAALVLALGSPRPVSAHNFIYPAMRRHGLGVFAIVVVAEAELFSQCTSWVSFAHVGEEWQCVLVLV